MTDSEYNKICTGEEQASRRSRTQGLNVWVVEETGRVYAGHSAEHVESLERQCAERQRGWSIRTVQQTPGAPNLTTVTWAYQARGG